MKKLFSLKELFCIFILCAILSVPLILPLVHSGYFPSQDGEWAVVRSAEMFREIRDLQFPARYSGVLNFGYGYPLFNFAYPFPYYAATGLHVLQFGFIDSVKILFMLSVLFSGFFMYLLSKTLWKNKTAGFLSAVLYMFLPYRLVDLYVRGSLGESLAFALYPLIIFCALLVYQNVKNIRAAALLAISFGLLIGTHNIMAVYMLIILGVFVLSCVFTQKTCEARANIVAIISSFLLSGFFWAPALLEKNNIALSLIPIADRNLYFVKFLQLVIPSWGFGTPTDTNPFSYNIGIAQIISLILSLAAFFILRKKLKTNVLFACFTILVLAFIIMMFSVAKFVWQLPLLSEINYPWTLLLPIGFLVSVISGSILFLPKSRIIVIALIILAVVFTIPNARVSSYNNNNDSYYMTNEATTTSSNELMPIWVKKQPSIRFEKKVEGQNITLSNLRYVSNLISFDVYSPKAQQIQINSIYYPGWKGTVNNSPVVISRNNKMGLMEVPITKGKNKVTLAFGETYVRIIFDIISLLAAVLLILILLFPKVVGRYIYEKEKNNKKK